MCQKGGGKGGAQVFRRKKGESHECVLVHLLSIFFRLGSGVAALKGGGGVAHLAAPPPPPPPPYGYVSG